MRNLFTTLFNNRLNAYAGEYNVFCKGILELQGWTDGMDPDSDPDLSLLIAVMTLVIGVMSLFIGIMTLIRGLVLRLMAPQIVYITGMWSELK